MTPKQIWLRIAVIVFVGVLVCMALRYIQPAHACESDSMFYNLSRECPK